MRTNTGFLAIATEVENDGEKSLRTSRKIKDLLKEFQDILLDDLPNELPPYRTHQHEIVEEPGSKPTFRALYRLSPTELTDMKKQIEYLQAKGLIRPSTSPCTAPVLFTPKPDGSLRMCIDYRALNKKPLMNLLKKNMPYKWESKHQEAVEQLKQAFTTAPVLILPDPERDYVIEADASDQAVGAVLMQDQGNGLQPIAYLSKKLHGAELNYPIHDKEAVAIVIAFKAWRCYLEGRRTTVYTDHCSLKYLKTQPNLSRRQVRWIDFLETHFHYDIVYKPTTKTKQTLLAGLRTLPLFKLKG
ncbi:hypothetical protein CLOP_g15458 [Closterium sp. NIES-67]|nr:hypothetical protein CLOP_g15458 [Closterium sp. NIES-67]